MKLFSCFAVLEVYELHALRLKVENPNEKRPRHRNTDCNARLWNNSKIQFELTEKNFLFVRAQYFSRNRTRGNVDIFYGPVEFFEMSESL